MSSSTSAPGQASLAMKEVQAKLREMIAKDPSSGWDDAWKESLTPWDAGQVQPPLRDLIESGRISFPRTGRALVPGCGRGYDPIFIASTLGLDVLAADISQTAVIAANELLSKTAFESSDRPKVTFQIADFFTIGSKDEERFGLIYDYTFFVAIQPSRRPEWGRQMTQLTKPGGYLITLVFPMDPPQDYGPPFFVRPEHYIEVLPESEWEVVLEEIPANSMETHIGREKLVVWKRK